MNAAPIPLEGVPFKEGIFVEGSDGDDGPRLLGSRCSECGTVVFPKRATCPKCKKTDDQKELRLGPIGTLYTFAVVRQAPAQFPTPYVIGYVNMLEGARVFTQIETAHPEALRLGQRMELTVGELASESVDHPRITYRFRPIEEE